MARRHMMMAPGGGMVPMTDRSSTPSISDLQQARTTIPGAKEVLRWELFDRQTYPAAGTTSMMFFQQATGMVDSTGHLRTEEDTNLNQGGTLPAGYHFLMTGAYLRFYPGLNPGRRAQDETVAAGAPNFLNDVYTFNKAGYLRFFVNTKDFIKAGSLESFPPPTRLSVNPALADTTTAGASHLNVVDYAAACGRPYHIQDLSILNGYNFGVELNWKNGLQALPSGLAASVYAVLSGFLYRTA